MAHLSSYVAVVLLLLPQLVSAEASSNYSLFSDKERSEYQPTTEPAIAINANLEANSKSIKHKTYWSTKSRWKSAEEATTSMEDLGIMANLVTTFELNRKFGFYFQGQAEVHSGQVQSVFENQSSDGFYMRQGYFYWLPVSKLRLSAGAHTQQELSNPLLLCNNCTFPGLRERFTITESDQFNVSLLFQQAVLTSRSLATRTSDIEPVPTLFTETLSAKWDSGKRWSLGGKLSYYEFKDLPQSVAVDSLPLGNSFPESMSAGTQRFLYEFKGLAASLNTQIELGSSIYMLLGTKYLENLEAPSGKNQGQIVSAAVAFDVTSNVQVKPSFEYFINQSDTSPAYFNEGDYGHNNREGTALGLAAHVRSMDLDVSAKFVKNKTINDNLRFLQHDQNFFKISVETGYEEI